MPKLSDLQPACVGASFCSVNIAIHQGQNSPNFNALNLIAHEALASRGIVVIKLTWHSAALVAYMYLACTTKTVQCLLVLASAKAAKGNGCCLSET